MIAKIKHLAIQAWENNMKKYAVHYKSRIFGNTYIHVMATNEQDAVAYVVANGIGYSNGIVFADEILSANIVH